MMGWLSDRLTRVMLRRRPGFLRKRRPKMQRLCCRVLLNDARRAHGFVRVLAAKTQAAGANDQAAAPSITGLVLEQTVRRVVVDVVVTDSDGRPVTGLTTNDFKVFEDGKRQTIRQFEAYTPANAGVLPARPADLPADTFLNLPATPEDNQAPLTVILFDALNTPLRDQMYARQQMLKFLKEMPAGVPTAIFVLSNRLHLLQGFSGEREVVLEAAKRQGPVVDQLGLRSETDANGAVSTATQEAEALVAPANTNPGTEPERGCWRICRTRSGAAFWTGGWISR
jgi:hypothetical protein